jgi:hypothetical protein
MASNTISNSEQGVAAGLHKIKCSSNATEPEDVSASACNKSVNSVWTIAAGIANRIADYTASGDVIANTSIEDICTSAPVKASEKLVRLSWVLVPALLEANRTFLSLALKKVKSLRFKPLKLFRLSFCSEKFKDGMM